MNMPNLWFIIDKRLYMFDKNKSGIWYSFFRVSDIFIVVMLWIVQFIYVVRSETGVQSVTAVLTEKELTPWSFPAGLFGQMKSRGEL